MLKPPAQMNFVQTISPGTADSLYIAQGKTPEPQSGEVLIQIHFAGINRPDILQRKGLYPPPEGASPILGLEVSGIVVAVGPQCKLWKVGDPVCALLPGGGYAEYCVVSESLCLPIPKNVTMEEAAGIPETFFTVWDNLFTRGRLSSGESLLVHGGSSGIGTTAIQLGRAFGAKVFTTAGTDMKCAACKSLGAYAAVNYQTHDFDTEIQRLNASPTNPKGEINVILDMIGGNYFSKNLELLATEGRLVQIAAKQGSDVTLSLHKLMTKRATITGSTLRSRSLKEKAEIATLVYKNIWPLLESKKVHVVIDQIYPLEQANNAHIRMEQSLHIGKILLQIK